uniref:Uncharacterized protein n=1 Tax=Anguilla anguilla TaxID=7936 RepID=A0A0E9VB81_ANGAN
MQRGMHWSISLCYKTRHCRSGMWRVQALVPESFCTASFCFYTHSCLPPYVNSTTRCGQFNASNKEFN